MVFKSLRPSALKESSLSIGRVNSQIKSLLITNAYIAFHISDITDLIVYELSFVTVTITRQIIETNSRPQLDFSASTAQASPPSYHLAATNHRELAENCKYTEMSIVSGCKSVQCFNLFHSNSMESHSVAPTVEYT